MQKTWAVKLDGDRDPVKTSLGRLNKMKLDLAKILECRREIE